MNLPEMCQGQGAGGVELHRQVLAHSSALPVPLSSVKFCGHGNVHKVCVFVPAERVCAACAVKPAEEPDGDRPATLARFSCAIQRGLFRYFNCHVKIFRCENILIEQKGF